MKIKKNEKTSKIELDTKYQYTIWHDGGEWIISVKGKEEEMCKTLNEWLRQISRPLNKFKKKN
jgi:ribosome-associated translation inhibitor RaiA